MKKIRKEIRKMLCAAMAVVTALSATAVSNAEEDNSLYSTQTETSEAIGTVNGDGYVLVSEEKYTDGDFLIIDRLYKYPGISTYAAENPGGDKFEKSRSIYDRTSTSSYGTLLAIMWVSGDFKWDRKNDTATISNPKAWIDHYESADYEVKAKDGYPKSGSNQGATTLGGVFGKKYAYIEYIITVKHKIKQYTTEYRLWLDVNIDGEDNVDN